MPDLTIRTGRGATIAIGPICPDCLGDGVVPFPDDRSDNLTECDRCGGEGWASAAPSVDVDDADHAEYVDPIDHTHDAPISAVALQQRLQAVLDIHRSTEDHVCAAEPHRLYPCPTARAALGIA